MLRLLQLQLIKVRVDTLEAKVKLVDSLRWLTKHPWGRRVKPYHGQRFGLRAMDKLCCGGSIGMDLHSLDGLSVPFEVIFFRPEENTPFIGIPVMWDVEGVHEFGIKHFRIDFFVDCILHTVDLGLAQRTVGPSLMCLLENDIYRLKEPTEQGTLERGALHMRKDFKKHYREYHVRGHKKLSRIQAFTLQKLGDPKKPCLKAKGAQSRAAVWFARDMLAKHAERCGQKGAYLLEACEQLIKWYDLVKAEPRNMRVAKKIQLFGHAMSHLQAYKAGGGHMVPKHHGFIHLTKSILTSGNPRFSGTYEDENENGEIADICGKVHRLTMVKSTFERLDVKETMEETPTEMMVS